MTPDPDRVAVEQLVQVVLHEAREKGANSPMDYGDAEQIVRAILAAQSAHPDPQGVPDGWKLVPIVSTKEMDEQGGYWLSGDRNECLWADENLAMNVWNVMLAATPPAPQPVVGEVEQGGTRDVQWEVWEDDMMVASSDSEADAMHYLRVYCQDGPVRLVRAETVRTPAALAHTTDDARGEEE